MGFSLITLRNGNRRQPERYPKTYAEKLLYLEEGQYAPMHFHWCKMEDIINRGGGAVLIRVFNSLADEEIDRESPVTVHCDGCERTVPAGTRIRLAPGQQTRGLAPAEGAAHRSRYRPGSRLPRTRPGRTPDRP